MKVGDKVKLKDDVFNHASAFQRYMNQLGTLIDMQPNKEYCRVMFSSATDYEDMCSWRLKIIS
jgi:hypothetical protein